MVLSVLDDCTWRCDMLGDDGWVGGMWLTCLDGEVVGYFDSVPVPKEKRQVDMGRVPPITIPPMAITVGGDCVYMIRNPRYPSKHLIRSGILPKDPRNRCLLLRCRQDNVVVSHGAGASPGRHPEDNRTPETPPAGNCCYHADILSSIEDELLQHRNSCEQRQLSDYWPTCYRPFDPSPELSTSQPHTRVSILVSRRIPVSNSAVWPNG